MQLIKSYVSGDWLIKSDIGRIYELAVVNGIRSNGWYDIVVIFDFDEDNDEDKNMQVVNFFYGASDFIDNPDSALGYIKTAITEYEKQKGFKSSKDYELIKEF